MTPGFFGKGAPLSALLLLSLLAAPARSADVIGFYTCYDSCIGSVTSEMGRYLTQVNLFNYTPNSWGGLSGYNFTSSTVQQIKDVGVRKVFMTIGGANYSSGFRGAVSSSYRTAFVNAIVSKANALDVDGVDIDWEYPETEDDANNFVAFLRQLKQSLGSKKLSVDVATQRKFAPFQQGSALYDIVDYVNVMNYDDFCATYDPNHSSFVKSYRNMQQWWLTVAPASKLVLGVPFYGKRYGGGSNCGNSVKYSEIYASSEDADEAGGVYFNGPVTMRDKGRYAKNAGFAGVMYWAIGQDKSDNTLLKALHAGLNSTSYSGEWRPGIEYGDNVAIRHDGKYWKRTFPYAVNVEPYQGSHNVLQFWKSSDEPFCDELYAWQSACAYVGPKEIEHDGRCFELPAGATSSAQEPGATGPWQEHDCSPCSSKQDGGPWYNTCTYATGDRVYYNGYYYTASRDVGHDGVGTPPGPYSEYYWTLETDGPACLPADFGAAGYLELNPDLTSTIGDNPTALARHYLNSGRVEGRAYTTANADRRTGMPICPSAVPADFSVEGYRLSNGARLTADGAYDDEELLLFHWTYWGAAEHLPYDGSSVAPRTAAAGSAELGFAALSGVALRGVRGEVRVEAVGVDGRTVRSARATAAGGTASLSWEPLRPGLWTFRVRHDGGVSVFRRALVD